MKYPTWRVARDTSLTPQEASLIKLMVNDRIAEVHASGSRRAEVRESVKLRIGTYRGGTSIIDHPPDAPPPETDKPKFYYIIDGVNREATEAAATYLALLQQMVAQFEAAHP